MSDRNDALNKYIVDMMALSKHIQQAVTRQLDDASVRHLPDVYQLIKTTDETLSRHNQALEAYANRYDGSIIDSVKAGLSEALGVAAGLYDRVRTNTASRMLRDDYTALSLAAISYTMLHTSGLALQDEVVADMAQNHLKELTPLIVEISKIIPQAVNIELLDDTDAVTFGIANDAKENTQEAWDKSNVNKAA